MTTTRRRVVVRGGVGAATAFALLLAEFGIAASIAAADELEEEVGGPCVVGEISQLVAHQKRGPGVVSEAWWAALMARVMGADLSACAACGGRLRIIAALTDRDLSGGGRAAGGAPAEGPATAAVRVRGLTSPPFAPGAVSRREECVLKGLIEYRIGPARGPQTTKPYCEPCQTTCNRSSASLPLE